MKLILADDEHKIRSAIKKLIQWDTLDLTLVGECENGEELLQSIASLRPDIVLTDMRMPGLNGAALLRELNRQAPWVKIVVLSGFDDFELVHEALRSHTVDYLLKPVNRQELNETLYKAVQECRKESDICRQIRRQKMAEYLEASLSDPAFTPKEEKGFEKICVSVLGIYSEDGCPDYRCIADVQDRLTLLLDPQNIAFPDKKKPGVLILFLYNAEPEAVQEFWNRQEVLSVLHDTGHFLVGIGSSYKSWSNLCDSYREAILALNSAEIGTTNRIFLYAHTLGKNQSPLEYEKVEYLLSAAAEKGDAVNFRVRLSELYGALARRRGTTVEQLSQSGERVLHLLEVLLSRTDTGNPFRKSLHDLKSQINGIIDPGTVCMLLTEFLDKAIPCSCLPRSEKRELADQIQNFLQEHYCEKLSLQDLESHFFMTKGYISKIFRQQFSIGIFDYLDHLRIARVKELLASGYSIREAAEQVGYYDESHLRRKFKKITGTDPCNYKLK